MTFHCIFASWCNSMPIFNLLSAGGSNSIGERERGRKRGRETSIPWHLVERLKTLILNIHKELK